MRGSWWAVRILIVDENHHLIAGGLTKQCEFRSALQSLSNEAKITFWKLKPIGLPLLNRSQLQRPRDFNHKNRQNCFKFDADLLAICE
mgnify:CR=1 FL=1